MKILSTTNPSDTLLLHECNDGYWLYDKTLKWNISMRAKSAEEALIEGLMYWQTRAIKIEKEHKEIKTKVDTFINQFHNEDEDYTGEIV